MVSKKLEKIYHCQEFTDTVNDLIESEPVQKMEGFMQHGTTSCFIHCLFVAYYSFKVCKMFSLDAVSAARAGMLHDLFLYDWHGTGFVHSYMHPRIALYNARRYFRLNAVECDMIENHMFPWTLRLPKYKETVVIMLVDKFCAVQEAFRKKEKQCEKPV